MYCDNFGRQIKRSSLTFLSARSSSPHVNWWLENWCNSQYLHLLSLLGGIAKYTKVDSYFPISNPIKSLNPQTHRNSVTRALFHNISTLDLLVIQHVKILVLLLVLSFKILWCNAWYSQITHRSTPPFLSSFSGKSQSNGTSSSSKSLLSSDELVEKLKKPSSVWSAPCNLTPPKLKLKPGAGGRNASPSASSKPYRASPSHNGHRDPDLKVRNDNAERPSSSRKLQLPVKHSSSRESNERSSSDKHRRADSSDRYRESSDKYRENSERRRDADRNSDRDRHRESDRHRDDRRNEKSREDIERDMLLEQFKKQQEEMRKLEEKLRQITEKKSSPVPSKSDDYRRKRSPSPRHSSISRSEKYGSEKSSKSSSDKYSSDKRVNGQTSHDDRPKLNGDRVSSKYSEQKSSSKYSDQKSRPNGDIRPSHSSSKDRTPSKSLNGELRKTNAAISDRKLNDSPGKPSKPSGSATVNGRVKPELSGKPKQFPPADLKPKQFPPADLKPRQFPPPDVRQRPKKPVKSKFIHLLSQAVSFKLSIPS